MMASLWHFCYCVWRLPLFPQELSCAPTRAATHHRAPCITAARHHIENYSPLSVLFEPSWADPATGPCRQLGCLCHFHSWPYQIDLSHSERFDLVKYGLTAREKQEREREGRATLFVLLWPGIDLRISVEKELGAEV